MKKIEETTESSEEMNATSSTPISSVNTQSVLSLLKAAILLLFIKVRVPKNVLRVLVFLSISVPLINVVIRLAGRFEFWVVWIMAFYGTIWSFGYFNTSNCDISENLPLNVHSRDFYVTRKIFLAWFFIEAILFFIVGRYILSIGRVTLLIIYFALFVIGGLIYGLGNVTCPHCRAINAGRCIRKTDERTDYRCCICKKEFSHYFGPR